jgi:DUF4097 and DUF4098 domain-containing protein YvlB
MTDTVARDAAFKISSGGIILKNCDITELSAVTSSGDIEADGLISDNITAETSSGNIDLEIVGNAADYSIGIDISSGNINLSGNGILLQTESDLTWGTGTKRIDCDSSSGNIDIKFV